MPGEPSGEGQASNWRRLGVTVAGLVLYWLCARLPLPGLDRDALGDFTSTLGSTSHRVSVLGLGLTPFLSGFVIVELLSFVIPQGRRLRQGGIAGRRRLNAFAVRLAVVVGIVQAKGLLLWLQSATSPAGAPLVPNPGMGFSVLAGMTLLAGTGIAFLIASLVSRWGLGNGFCVLMVLSPFVPSLLVRGLVDQDLGLTIVPLEPIAWILAIGLLLYRFAAQEPVPAKGPRQEEVPFVRPAFQQGLVPLIWTYTAVGAYWSWVGDGADAARAHLPAILGAAVLVAGLSLATFHLFSSRKRLEKNLPPGSLPPTGEVAGGRSLVEATGLLLLLGVGFLAGRWLLGFQGPLGFPVLVMLVALGFDVVEEWRFRKAHGKAVTRLLELDNVHLASYLRGLLRAHGIDALARTYHYRSLFFFFQPLVKMDLVVPASQLDRSRELVRPDELSIV